MRSPFYATLDRALAHCSSPRHHRPTCVRLTPIFSVINSSIAVSKSLVRQVVRQRSRPNVHSPALPEKESQLLHHETEFCVVRQACGTRVEYSRHGQHIGSGRGSWVLRSATASGTGSHHDPHREQQQQWKHCGQRMRPFRTRFNQGSHHRQDQQKHEYEHQAKGRLIRWTHPGTFTNDE